MIAWVVYELINECSWCNWCLNDVQVECGLEWCQINNENMFDTLHTKGLTKCLNENCIDYLVSLWCYR